MNAAGGTGNVVKNNGSSSSNESLIEKAQMDAVAAAAAFLLTLPTTKNGEETACSSTATDGNGQHSQQHQPPISQKGNNWTHLGTFQIEEDMHRVRNKEKVSKRRTEQLKNGVKIRYRCNTWKRTKCGFQMFSFFNAHTGLIDLYECGEHDHSGRRKLEYELYGPKRRVTTATNDQNNCGMLKTNTKVQVNAIKESDGTGNSITTDGNQWINPKKSSFKQAFTLDDSEIFRQLNETASKFELKFSKDCPNHFSLRRENDKLLLTLVESSMSIKLTTESDDEHVWMKADWDQFLWAIQGLLAFSTTQKS